MLRSTIQRIKMIHKLDVQIGMLLILVLSTIIISITKNLYAGWQPGNPLNQTFWDQIPNTGNLLYSLYGNGNPGDTSYTKTWNASCIASNVVYTTTVPTNPSAHTVYVFTGGEYAIDTNTTIANDCIAFVGIGKKATLKFTLNSNIKITGKYVIIDNLTINANGGPGLEITSPASYVTLQNSKIYGANSYGANIAANNITLNKTQVFNSQTGIIINDSQYITLNNVQTFNNTQGLYITNSSYIAVNNSQSYNNTHGISLKNSTQSFLSNTISYNNDGYGLSLQDNQDIALRQMNIYNNTTGIYLSSGTNTHYYDDLNLFTNTTGVEIINSTGSYGLLEVGSEYGTLGWFPGILGSGEDMDIDFSWITNPRDIQQKFFIDTDSSIAYGKIAFTPSYTNFPLTYIFGNNIPKQTIPYTYKNINNEILPTAYGNQDIDYNHKEYIGEPENPLTQADQDIISSYFGSGSIITKTWNTNSCSPGAFAIKYIDKNDPNKQLPTTLEGHTLYIFTGAQYDLGASSLRLRGDCIGIVGNGSIISSNNNTQVIYGNKVKNIFIIDAKIDGTSNAMYGIRLDGKSNNNTLDHLIVSNTKQDGIFLGQMSHNNTVSNSVLFNHAVAGIEIYYGGTHNFINNTLIFNNLQGIKFANGSYRNTINNSQIFNNRYGIVGDFTTQENFLHNLHIYNNSSAGIYFRMSSGNILHDVWNYNNTEGIKIEGTSSVNNKYLGTLTMFANKLGNITGVPSSGMEMYFKAGEIGYDLDPVLQENWIAGELIGSGTKMDCDYTTNITAGGFSFFKNSVCDGRGITGWNAGLTQSLLYDFGSDISYQSKPVLSFSGTSAELISDTVLYTSKNKIGEIDFLTRRDPNKITFDPDEYICGDSGCKVNTRYTIPFSYKTGTLVTSAQLTFTPSTSGYFEILSGDDQWIATGTTLTNLHLLKARIKAKSHTKYGETNEGTLTLQTTQGTLTGLFYLNNRDFDPNTCEINVDDKVLILNIYRMISSKYTDKQKNMLIDDMEMLLSKDIDLEDGDESCYHEYIVDLIDKEAGIDPNLHIAPNCKEYKVNFSESRSGYTSSSMKKPLYFISRETLTRYIDSFNPGDCHINTYYDNEDEYINENDNLHVALNGKLYRIKYSTGSVVVSGSTNTQIKDMYTSADLKTEKIFDNLRDLREYIDKYNPPREVWDHEIDQDESPFYHVAPNGKVYKVYHTDKGYMSYKFSKVKYFDFLDEMKSYINTNNPKK